jgi:hypothetical protein
MNDTVDPFVPDKLRLSPELAKELEQKQADHKARSRRAWKQQDRLFAMLPIEQFQSLAASTQSALLATILELDRLVLNNYGRSNKAKLSNHRLRQLGILHQAKSRALRLLEREGLITVKRNGRACPSVTVHWRPAAA